ncbi:hypothetical protein STAFG_0615 [Streptomyces afghaniensis 772]|uniref:Uncharacterized protein n=1 Tax=Streptomyces afghaniensis 772 TaxID=1283301 RepID=S4MYU8_9ACTN|nr:hypothetical protein STAFG_0615 [Streptomyces afghaniensis 772]
MPGARPPTGRSRRHPDPRPRRCSPPGRGPPGRRRAESFCAAPSGRAEMRGTARQTSSGARKRKKRL